MREWLCDRQTDCESGEDEHERICGEYSTVCTPSPVSTCTVHCTRVSNRETFVISFKIIKMKSTKPLDHRRVNVINFRLGIIFNGITFCEKLRMLFFSISIEFQPFAISLNCFLSMIVRTTRRELNFWLIKHFILMLCCSGACSSDEFQCKDYSCVPISQRCDGVSHCQDVSDEQLCGE